VNNFKKASNDTRQLTYVGYGNYFPIANNITAKGIQSNSRIQITAYPTKDQLLMDRKKRTFGNIGESFADNDPNLVTFDDPSQSAENHVDYLPQNVVGDSKDMEG
jgi:hypothetical protein